MKENKGFSPSFDIFSPLVKASFQQFGTFLLMLMLPTRNSISFHFVPPPSPDDRGGHRVQNPTFVQPKVGNTPRNPEWIEYGCSGRDLCERRWRCDRIIGIFLLKSMSFLRQAGAKRGLIHANQHI